MPSAAQALIAELDAETPATRRVLERLPETQFGWRPPEQSYEDAWKRAAEYADKALLLAPDDAEAHNIRARIDVETGEV